MIVTGRLKKKFGKVPQNIWEKLIHTDLGFELQLLMNILFLSEMLDYYSLSLPSDKVKQHYCLTVCLVLGWWSAGICVQIRCKIPQPVIRTTGSVEWEFWQYQKSSYSSVTLEGDNFLWTHWFHPVFNRFRQQVAWLISFQTQWLVDSNSGINTMFFLHWAIKNFSRNVFNRLSISASNSLRSIYQRDYHCVNQWRAADFVGASGDSRNRTSELLRGAVACWWVFGGFTTT